MPLVPVTAKAEVPAVADEPTATVSVLLPFPVMLVGEKVAVTPCGRPLTDNATTELNPFKLATVTVNEVELPAFTLAPVGFGVRVKVGAKTVRVNVTVRVNPPPIPVMVIG